MNGNGQDKEYRDEIENGPSGGDRLWGFSTTRAYLARWLPIVGTHVCSYGAMWCQRLHNAVSSGRERHEPVPYTHLTLPTQRRRHPPSSTPSAPT